MDGANDEAAPKMDLVRGPIRTKLGRFKRTARLVVWSSRSLPWAAVPTRRTQWPFPVR